jgi:hypothetical protein
VTPPISASQIKTASSCLRKWGWEKLEGKRTPPTPAMLRGTRLHACAEKYLKGEDVTDHPDWPLVRQAVRHLPQDLSTVRAEQKFELVDEGIEYHGFIDWATPTRFGDHKTCSTFDYALTPESLLADPQYLLYSKALGLTEALWIYYRTRAAPAIKLVEADPTRRTVDKCFDQRVRPVASQLVQIREKRLTVKQLPPTLEACFEYGGCPHRSYCKPEEWKMSDDIMSLFGKAKASLERPMPVPHPQDAINPPEAHKPPSADIQAKTPSADLPLPLPPLLRQPAIEVLAGATSPRSVPVSLECMVSIVQSDDALARRAFEALRPLVIEALSK